MAASVKWTQDISDTDKKLFGRESVLLSKLKRAGLPVQKAFVVSSAAQADFGQRKGFSDEIKEEIEGAYALLGFESAGKKSVDDLLSKSPDVAATVWPASAPQARKLNISGFTNIMQAVREIWAKHKSPIIIQRQINPEKSGSARTEGGKLKIDAAWGFYAPSPDKNSMVVADEFGRLIRKNIPDSLKSRELISSAEHELISKLASKSESVAGQPISINWSLSNKAVYLDSVSTSAETYDYAAGFSFLENGLAKQNLIDNLLNVFDGLNIGKPKAPKGAENTSYLEIFFNTLAEQVPLRTAERSSPVEIVAPIADRLQVKSEKRASNSELVSIYDEVCATNLQALVVNTKAACVENAILDLSELSSTENLSEYENLIFEKASSIKNPWVRISSPLDKESAEIFSAEVKALKRLSENDPDFGILVSGMTTINGFKRAKEILRQAGLQARIGLEFDNMNSIMISDVLCRLSDFATANVKKLQQQISGRPLLRALQDIHRGARVAGIPFSPVLHSPDKSLTEFLIRDGFETIAAPEKISDTIKLHVLETEKKLLLVRRN
ncbi:MAG: hypothetical protein HY438_02830 [DPANN group archaeon]|nr:hypothetical protein [DPANN group archaeon]